MARDNWQIFQFNSANTVARVVANQILPLWGAPITHTQPEMWEVGVEILQGPIHTKNTWPPGLVPDPNCTPQICCSSGNTHPPTKKHFRTHSSTKFMHNLTAWYQLKIDPGDTIGNMHTLHKKTKTMAYTQNSATMLKIWNLQHIGAHIQKHIMTHIWDSRANVRKPKTFVWTNRKEGMSVLIWPPVDTLNPKSVQNCTQFLLVDWLEETSTRLYYMM